MKCLMKILVGFVCAVLVSIGASIAETGDWQVVETSGTVRTSQAMAGVQQVSTGNVLGAGSVLSTGANGHAVLMRGEQQIVVGPNSRMSLPVTQESGMTKIVQDLGTLLFKVDKKEKQHFQVETPIIAAVVKGTTFTVTAGVSGHSVHVAEGAVEVSAISGGANQMVTAGMTATISKSNPRAIQVSSGSLKSDGSTPADGDRKGKEASNLVVPTEVGADKLDYVTLSNGVIQPGQTTSAEARGRANAAMGNNVSSAVRGQGGGAAAVAQIRMNAVESSNRGVGNAFGAGGNKGVGNGGASVDVNVGNGNGNNGNGNGNGGPSVDVNVGNGNGNNGNGNGNGGIGVGVGVGGVEVEIGADQGGVGLGLGLGKSKN